jgi:electron transport complex protein RnfA
VLMAGLRERFALVAIPKPFEGTAIGLVTAGLIALAFSGFAGLV